MSTLLIFGTVVMGGSELVLFSRYFAQERYDTLDEVVNVAQRTASYLVQEASLPEGEELEALSTKLEIIGESAEAYLFFTDCDGNVMLASVPEKLTGDTVRTTISSTHWAVCWRRKATSRCVRCAARTARAPVTSFSARPASGWRSSAESSSRTFSSRPA